MSPLDPFLAHSRIAFQFGLVLVALGAGGDTGLDPSGTAAMTGPHLCEYENWPGEGPKPSGRRRLSRSDKYLFSRASGSKSIFADRAVVVLKWAASRCTCCSCSYPAKSLDAFTGRP